MTKKLIYLLSFLILSMNSLVNSKGTDLMSYVLEKSSELKDHLGNEIEEFIENNSNVLISKIKQSGSTQLIQGVSDKNFDGFLKLFLRTVEDSKKADIEKYLNEIKNDNSGEWKELSFLFRDKNRNKAEFTQIFGIHENGKSNFQVTKVSSEIELSDGENMFILEDHSKNKETSIVGNKYTEKEGLGLFNYMKKKAYDTFLEENSHKKSL